MAPITDNLNVASNDTLITPEQLKEEMPLAGEAQDSVKRARDSVFSILDRKDPRLFVVVGPCSIHDTEAAMDYAHRLKELAEKVKKTLYIVMRVYFEKPRTSIGWKGLINDPHLDGLLQQRHLILFLHNSCKILLPGLQLALVQPSHKRTEKCLLVCLLRLVLKMVLMVG